MKVLNAHTVRAPIVLKKLEGEDLKRAEEAFRLAPSDTARDPHRLPDTHPSKRRADVVVAGRWAATVYESGGVNVADKYVGAILAMNNDRLTADQIARKVATATGGIVAKPRDWD